MIFDISAIDAMWISDDLRVNLPYKMKFFGFCTTKMFLVFLENYETGAINPKDWFSCVTESLNKRIDGSSSSMSSKEEPESLASGEDISGLGTSLCVMCVRDFFGNFLTFQYI